MEKQVKVSVVCPIRNEEGFICKCIESLLKQDYPQENLELLFVDGMSSDRTQQIVKEYRQKYSNIHLLINPDKIVPTALNLGIKESEGETIIRVDGHCEYPTNYISELVHNLYKLNADNVGGVWNTLPANENIICKAIAIAVSHKFGIGNSDHKVGVTQVIETDTVPFGCFRRDVFERYGLFDTDLTRNQDDEFNGRIVKNGGKIFLIPSVEIDYYARNSISKMSKMFYQYGLFKPLVNKKLGSPATLRQFAPIFFLLGLIGGLIVCPIYPILWYPFLFILIVYSIISLTISIKQSASSKELGYAFLLPYMFFIIHMSYGYGYLEGIIKLICNKKLEVEINR